MRIDGPQITGSFSLNGDGLPDLDVLATTSSLNTYTSSIDTTMGHVMTATHSLNTFTSSASSRLSTIESTTGSLNSFSNSINSYTSSNDSTNTTQNSRLNSIEGATGSYATTGSNTFNGNLTVTGFIEAQELRTTYISSSILYRSGSTKFGDELSDTHAFTGSLNISGSVNVGSAPIESNATRIKINNTEIGTVSAYGSNNNGDPIIIIKNSATGNALTINPNELGNFSYFYPSGLVSINSLNVSGSTKFGDELGDTHSFTGSLSVSGSISVPGSGLVSGSAQITYSGLSGVPSGIISGSAQLPSGIISGSAQLPSGIISGSAQVISSLPSGTVSGSAQVDVMSTTNIARLATTGSNSFTGTQTFGYGRLVASGHNSSAQITINASYDGGQSNTYTPDYAGDGSAGMFLMKQTNGGYGDFYFYGKQHGTTGGSHALSTFNQIMGMNVNGRVAIGKLTANTPLDVNGNTLVTGSITSTVNVAAGTTISWNSGVGALSYGGGVVTMETNSATPILLKTNGTTAITISTGQTVTFANDILTGIDKGIKFDSSGASGHPEIGVDSSANLNFKNSAGTTNLTLSNGGNLTVTGTITTSGNINVNSDGIFINRSSSGEPYVFFQKNGVNRGSIYGVTGGGLRIFDESDNQVLTITGTRLGISDTNPSEKLDVNGNGRFQGTTMLGGNVGLLQFAMDGTRWNHYGYSHLHIKTSILKGSDTMISFNIRGYYYSPNTIDTDIAFYNYNPVGYVYGVTRHDKAYGAFSVGLYYSSDNYVCIWIDGLGTYGGFALNWINTSLIQWGGRVFALGSTKVNTSAAQY